jgi:long-subunit acyl-CoA synthetase (AMP-forming)
MGVQLTHGCGMAEVPMITKGAPDDGPELPATTEGRPPEGMEIRIADGEARPRGEAVCRGYPDPRAGNWCARWWNSRPAPSR